MLLNFSPNWVKGSDAGGVPVAAGRGRDLEPRGAGEVIRLHHRRDHPRRLRTVRRTVGADDLAYRQLPREPGVALLLVAG